MGLKKGLFKKLIVAHNVSSTAHNLVPSRLYHVIKISLLRGNRVKGTVG